MLLQFCLYSGSQIKETLELTFDDIDFENKIINFTNKINKKKIDCFPLTEILFNITQELRNFAIIKNRNKLFSWYQIQFQDYQDGLNIQWRHL